MQFHSAKVILPSIDATGTEFDIETTSSLRIKATWAPIALHNEGPNIFVANWTMYGENFPNKRVRSWATS